MEELKRNRATHRRAFSRVANELDVLLTEVSPNEAEVESKFELLEEKRDSLRRLDEEVYALMLEEDVPDDALDREMEVRDEYTSKYTRIRAICRRVKQPDLDGVSSAGNRSMVNTRKYKLPQIEFKKFGGDIREWLTFWSQFKKINDDEDIPPEDKFQYLLLTITPGTRARELVESYPPTAENYGKAIESLKARFGREDLQIEVYVRELLKLVVHNALSKNVTCNLTSLYDKIETQLRSLETLGITTDTYAAMLYPLVESCLPEELLRVWQRSTDILDKPDDSPKNRLNKLMHFMKIEVEGEERIALAIEGLGFGSKEKPKNIKIKSVEPSLPTASGLLNYANRKCVFCEGSHHTEKCYKAQNMTVEQRRKVLTGKRACFRCAKVGHRAQRCRERIKCVLCGGQHLALLCPDLETKSPSGKHEENIPGSSNKDSKGTNYSKGANSECALANLTDTPVFLQTLRVKVRNSVGEREVRVILDSGSQRSYLLKTTAQEFDYPVKRTEKIVHALFGGTQTSEQLHECYDVRLASLDKKYSCTFEVLDQPVICHNITSIYPGVWTSELQRENIVLSDDKGSGSIELLIGSDVLGKLLTGKRCILPCGLVAVQTLLGWVLMGKVPKKTPSTRSVTAISLLTADMGITDLWQLDVLGITDPGENRSKIERELATKKVFKETIVFNDEKRYEVNLPWTEGHPPLPSNHALSIKRLDSAISKLHHSGYYDKYQTVFLEWEKENIIEEVPQEELKNFGHYLPHRPVIKEQSLTTKVRPVFDASAREKGKPSLNDCLEKGPNLLELIPTLLLRFRKERIGVTSDIRKAFLQISLNKKDRDFLRFLWITKEGVEKVYRHKRVVFGVKPSPFLLGATIEYHLNECLKKCEDGDVPYSKGTVNKLLNGFYVDNCVTSLPDMKSLNTFIIEASELMLQASFDLRGWEYNGNTGSDVNPIPILGLNWNKETDVFTLNHSSVEIDGIVSKRMILSITQRVFDPIGFSCPATLFPKLLLQRLWKQKIGWDSEVDKNSKTFFKSWTNELNHLFKIEIPRWIGAGSDENPRLSLHIFCDASKVAYATAIFLRREVRDGVKIHLIQAKSRVAPVKLMSIPRLELLAASIGARLYSQVREPFNGEIESYFWSDSTTVLSWIKREDEWATFVWNRVQEIRLLTIGNTWRHVPGALNPADLPSRGCSPKYLAQSNWWEGPDWLYQPKEEWPNEEPTGNEIEINAERKKGKVSTLFNSETVRFYDYFSKYHKILRMIAWIFRFGYNCRNRNNPRVSEFSADEIDHAEKILIRMIQNESFSKDNDKQFVCLNVFKDQEGICRLKTRIASRDDLETFRYPFLLPGKHSAVRKLIYDTHVKSCHVGTQGLMNLLRERYWILGGRRLIRSVVSSCKYCKRHNSKGIRPTPIELPLDRVRDAITFEITGVDLAGPIFTKTGKVWICIFTCAVYRAIHLDITATLSTADFLKTLRRFIARRGRPHVIYTDNGTNFIGTENLFNRLDWEQIVQFSSEKRIIWRFNPPSAPWWGGWWERLIRLVKQLLRRTLGRANLSNEELYTVLCDCEAVVNSRPLTYVSGEYADLIPLTPVMFTRELSESGVPDCDTVDTTFLNRRIRYLQNLRDDLRKRFRIEYLGQLRQYYKCTKTDIVSVGDVVLIGNDNLKRIDWPLARVVELLPGRDGKTRLVRVETKAGQLLRPVQRIYPLETVPRKEDSLKMLSSTDIVQRED